MMRRLRSELVWAPLLYVAATLWLYRVVLGGDVGFGWDTIESYWPDLRYLAANIASGDWPLWNPYDRGGYPYFADPQPGATYPIQWLFALASTTADHGWWLIQAKVLLHHAIAGIAMHAFLRTRGLSRPAAIIGGLTWLGSSPLLIHKASNILWPMVWLPLVWIAIDAALHRPTWRRGVLIAGALYLAGSAGSPPGFFYVLVAAFLYGGFRLTSTFIATPAPERRQRAIKTLIALAVATAVTVALLAIVALPALEVTDATTRAKRTVGYALSLPLPVLDSLFGLLGPAVARGSAYFGVGAVMLGLIAVAATPTRDRGAPVFFFLAAVFFLVLAFGESTPLLRWLVEKVPGFGMFRISNRYKLVFVPMAAVLAGFGADAVISAVKSWSRERWIALAVIIAVLAATLAVALAVEGPAKPLRSRWVAVVVALLSAGLITSCLLASRRSSAIVIGALAVLIFLDPVYTHFARRPAMEKQPEATKVERLAGLEGITTEWRVYDEFLVGERAGSRYQVRDFRGYPSGDPLDFLRYREILKVVRKRPELLEAFNVRYLLHKRHPRNGVLTHHVKRPPPANNTHFKRSRRGVYEAAHPAPLVAWYGEVRKIGRAKVLAALLESDRGDGVRAFAVLEPMFHQLLSAPLAEAPAQPEVAGRLVSFENDRIEISIDAPARGIVVLNEVFYAGWRVSVDGKAATALRANYLLRGVEVGAGAHRIVWEFRPSGQRSLTFLFALGWFALIAAFSSWTQRRRAPH